MELIPISEQDYAEKKRKMDAEYLQAIKHMQDKTDLHNALVENFGHIGLSTDPGSFNIYGEELHVKVQVLTLLAAKKVKIALPADNVMHVVKGSGIDPIQTCSPYKFTIDNGLVHNRPHPVISWLWDEIPVRVEIPSISGYSKDVIGNIQRTPTDGERSFLMGQGQPRAQATKPRTAYYLKQFEQQWYYGGQAVTYPMTEADRELFEYVIFHGSYEGIGEGV